jgi:hypothetical protein
MVRRPMGPFLRSCGLRTWARNSGRGLATPDAGSLLPPCSPHVRPVPRLVHPGRYLPGAPMEQGRRAGLATPDVGSQLRTRARCSLHAPRMYAPCPTCPPRTVLTWSTDGAPMDQGRRGRACDGEPWPNGPVVILQVGGWTAGCGVWTSVRWSQARSARLQDHGEGEAERSTSASRSSTRRPSGCE